MIRMPINFKKSKKELCKQSFLLEISLAKPEKI